MNDNDDDYIPRDSWLVRWFWPLYVVCFALLIAGGLWQAARAQTLTAPTRISPYDWACLDANGAVLSNHQRFDTAFVACYNNASGVEIVGGRYRIARPTAPPVEPPVEPEPEPDPPPVALTAPTNLKGTITPNQSNPGNSDVTLTWDAVAGATGYDIDRCTGSGCSNFAVIASSATTSYLNSNLPPSLTFKYGVRAKNATATGPWVASPLVVTTPTAPPPPATGTATLQWTPPTQNTDGSALTNLAGFRIVYGTDPARFTDLAEVANPAVTSYVVDGLAAGTWHFAVRAYTTAGGESQNSNVVSKAVQ